MANNIPIIRTLEGKEFYEESDADKGKYGVPDALEACQKEHEALFMPEMIDTRINSDKDARIWGTWFLTTSLRATGKTSQENAVVVYAHVPNYFSNPKNIREAIRRGLVYGAGIMPREDFRRLVDLDGITNAQGDRLVWVIDCNTLKNSPSGVISLDDALNHPQTIPFAGGEKRAEEYLQKHKQIYGNKIGIWHSHDLTDEPLGRVLCVGGSYGYSLNGNYYLCYCGRFAGVKKSAEGTSQKILPGANEIINVIKEFPAPRNVKELEQRI